MISLRILVFILGMTFLIFLEAHLYCLIFIGTGSPEIVTHGVGISLLILVLTCYFSVIADAVEVQMDQKLKELMRDQGTVAAIKYYRLTKGCNLRTAMEYIDSLKPLHPNPKSKTPCSYCGILLRTDLAKQCFECGKDWHMEIHGCDIFFENVQCEITEDLVVPVIKKYWPDVVYEKQIEDDVVHLFIHPNKVAEAAWDNEGWSEENDTTLIYVIWDAVKHQITFVIDDNKANKFIVDDIKNTIGF